MPECICRIANLRRSQLIFTFAVLYVAIGYLTNNFLFTDASVHASPGFEVSEGRIDEFIRLIHARQYFVYPVIPLLLLAKWCLISGALYAVLRLFNNPLEYKNCFKIVLVAEAAPITGALVKAICLWLFRPESYQDAQMFYPLSLIQLFDRTELSPNAIYPVQHVNVFEVAYFGIMALGISKHLGKPFCQGCKFTVLSYGPILISWFYCVNYLQTQFA